MEFEYESMEKYLPMRPSYRVTIKGLDKRWRLVKTEEYEYSYKLIVENAIISPRIYDISFLKANAGMSDNAVAETLGISKATVQRSIQEAIRTNINTISGLATSSHPMIVLLARLASWGLLEESTKLKLTAPESQFLTKDYTVPRIGRPI